MELLHIHDGSIVRKSQEVAALPTAGYLWMILERNEPFDLNAWLRPFGRELNTRHLEDIAQINHPSFYECMKDYDVMIFRSLSNRREESRRRLFESTTFIMFKDLAITIYDKTNASVSKFVTLFTDNHRSVPVDAETLVEFCLDQFIHQTLELKQNFDNKLTIWQKKLLQTKGRGQQDWNSLLDFKTDVRRVKMLCEEQYDTIASWQGSLRLELDKRHKHSDQLMININDLTEHANRMVKLTTQAQLELESLLQLNFTIMSYRTNEIMRILALISGIFLPANLITGIFGMNFTHMPDLTRPHGFATAIGGMVVISIVLLGFFRWRRWL